MGSKARSRSRTRNAWHQGFAQLVMERRPPSSAARSEVELSQRPNRIDLVIERRTDLPPCDDKARILRGLWSRLSEVTLLEFKSPTRGFRASELARLIGHAWHHFALNWRDLAGRECLTLVLVVPAVNQALRDEINKLECQWVDLEPGYAELHGLGYTTYVVATDVVAEAECDEYLRLFSHHEVHDPAAIDWLQDWLVTQESRMPQVKRSRSFQEMRAKLLGSMTVSERLQGLEPEKVLEAYTPEQLVAYIETLPESTRRTIRVALTTARPARDSRP